MLKEQPHPSSFRDPSGNVFTKNGTVYRRINQSYEAHYRRLLESGLYQTLVEQELLVAHDEISAQSEAETQVRKRKPTQPNILSDSGLHVLDHALMQDATNPATLFKVIRPNAVDFISYPYEWCFSELKDAALVTLQIQKLALQHDMTLKDASAFNIQFINGLPVLIDTLSFECWTEGTPWSAYRQFCQHFLAPLALMSYVDPRLNTLFKTNIDGVPLDLAGKLLPKTVWLKPSLVMHLLAHAKAKHEQQIASNKVKLQSRFSRASMLGLIESLEASVQALKSPNSDSMWSQYYANNNYSDEAMDAKEAIVTEYILATKPRSVWDLGANTGRFSQIAANFGAQTVSMDFDAICVERNYLNCKSKHQRLILPLVVDLTQPSPSLGWANEERSALEQRGKADVALALAIIHHLAIAKNVPLVHIARYLSQLSRYLIIEFVPKSDSQVAKLLAHRTDIFSQYSQDNFEEQFKTQFEILRQHTISGTKRVVYLMRSKNA